MGFTQHVTFYCWEASNLDPNVTQRDWSGVFGLRGFQGSGFGVLGFFGPIRTTISVLDRHCDDPSSSPLPPPKPSFMTKPNAVSSARKENHHHVTVCTCVFLLSLQTLFGYF